eukprot:250218_1
MTVLSQFIIRAYSRHIEQLLSTDQINGIPNEIMIIISNYWQYKLLFCTRSLTSPHIRNGGLSARKTASQGFDTFIFGVGISHLMCNKYNIIIKMNQLKSLYVGYIKQNHTLKSCSDPLGTYGNKDCSVGVLVDTCNNQWSLCDDKHEYVECNCKTTTQSSFVDNGNILIISFNLKENYFAILNGRKYMIISLNNNKKLIPSFTLCYKSDTIEILKYTFH